MLINIRHKGISIKKSTYRGIRNNSFGTSLAQVRRDSVVQFCNIWQEFFWWPDFERDFAWIALKIESSWPPCCNSQWCIVPIWTQGPQQSRRPRIHGRHWGHPHQQWSGTQHIADNKSSDVISYRRQTQSIVCQCQNGSLHAMHSQGSGTSINLHPHTNHQLDCPCTTYQQNYAQGFEGHGHVIPLVVLPQSTGPVSFLLETWNPKFGRLLDQASSSQPPQSFLVTNPNVFNK